MVEPWQRIEPTTVTKVGYRTIVSKTYIMPDGRTQVFDIKDAEKSGGVDCIAITSDNKVLIFRQYRPGPERIMDEMPGGMIDADDPDVEATALRELAEETGYAPKGKVTYLGKVSYDAFTNGWRHYFLMEGCEPLPQGAHREPNEQGGELLQVSVAELIQIAREGRMTDSGGVLLAYEHLQKLM